MNQPLSPDGPLPDPPDDTGHSIRNWPEHVLRGLPALVAYLDPDLCVRFANQPPRRWLGLPSEDLGGRPVRELLDEASAPRVIEALQAALAGRPSTVEGVLFTGRAHRYMHASFQPDADAQDRVQGVFAVFIDITERHALELKLRESEQRFFGAFQHAAIGMALVRPDGRFLRVNQAVCRMLGYSEEEFLTLSIADITHPDDYAADAAQVEKMLAGGIDAYQMEKRNLHKDGHVVHFQLSVSLVRDEHGKPLYFVSQVEDISQRKQYEEALFRERELAEVTLHRRRGDRRRPGIARHLAQPHRRRPDRLERGRGARPADGRGVPPARRAHRRGPGKPAARGDRAQRHRRPGRQGGAAPPQRLRDADRGFLRADPRPRRPRHRRRSGGP
jgi:PAS domain S-box-containing protein